jgi:4-hydroxybenzoate polyprenyltransferase
LKAAVTVLRPQQWVKNLLVFVPIITAGAIRELSSWRTALLVFFAFNFVASALYILNDLSDVSADRKHPRKRNRPFASSELPIPVGLVLLLVLLICGIIIGAAVGGLMFLLIYAVLSGLYSLKLKLFPIVDLFCLAALYSLRLFAGGEVSGHPVSFWLLAYSSFLFFSLATVKRVAELGDIGKATRGYGPGDRDILQSFGVAATWVSSNVLALYLQSETVAAHYKNPKVLWAIVPLLLLWQCRLWLATTRGSMHDDPIVFASRDWVSRVIAFCLCVTTAIAFIGL